MSRIITSIVAITLVFLSFSGCAKIDKTNLTKIEVAFWGSPEEKEIITETINKWEKDHPNIKVILNHIAANGYSSKILTRIAAGSAPDIMFAEVNIFTSFMEKGAFLDLTQFINEDPDISIDDFFPEVVDRFTIGGKLYCLPRDTAPFACVFYNKSIFDAAEIPYPKDDWTMDEMLETAKKLTIRKGNEITQYGFYSWCWMNFIYSFGGSIVDNVKNPGEFTFERPGTIEGIQFYSDLMNKYEVMPSSTALANIGMALWELFTSGKLAMYSSGIWETPQFRKISNFDWDVVMFPKGPSGTRAFGTGGSGYCIYKETKYPREAWLVLKALSGSEGQGKLAEDGLAQPAMRKIAEGPAWALSSQKPKNKKMLNEAVKYVIYEPFTPKWREIQDNVIMPNLDLVFNGKKKMAEMAPEIDKKANILLNEK
ncbi:MAG: sugar ABC transporter substrate-binding protein [Candidatus Aureabacteria bacterium]|nr:sugar ABC transporter substrate-binding protein [Candidatus Auribacterota bacterium]